MQTTAITQSIYLKRLSSVATFFESQLKVRHIEPLLLYGQILKTYHPILNSDVDIIQNINTEILRSYRQQKLLKKVPFGSRFFYSQEVLHNKERIITTYSTIHRKYFRVGIKSVQHFDIAVKQLNQLVKRLHDPSTIEESREFLTCFSYLYLAYEIPVSNKFLIEIIKKFNFELVEFFPASFWAT